MEDIKSGVLYMVATPIGNLEDITRRAVQILAQVDVIAAEDTRHSRKLLQHLGINNKPVFSCHDHSNSREIGRLLQRLREGGSMALISDAGTPLISDPGFALVEAARDEGIEVLPVPGASALTAALSVAGLPTDRFVFEGFPPAREEARVSRLRELKLEPRTLVFFETPHRISQFLASAVAVFGADRKGFIGRELTKKFEEHRAGNLASVLEWLRADPRRQRGEFVVVVHGCSREEAETIRVERAVDVVSRLRPHLSLKQSVARACELTGARKNAVYELALQREEA